MTRILITGVTGQDGSYLAEQLIPEGHDVWGFVRNTKQLGWADELITSHKLKMFVGDLQSQADINGAVRYIKPEEIYNLGAVTAPGGTWTQPISHMMEVTGLAILYILQAVCVYDPTIRVVHASSSSIYDSKQYGLYGAWKDFAHNIVRGLRNGHGIHASNAILFSHTSARQSDRFLIQQIVDVATKQRLNKHMRLYNLSAKRRWAWAPDVVRALPLMARYKVPGDFDVAGDLLSLHQIVEKIFEHSGTAIADRVILGSDNETIYHESPPVHTNMKYLGWTYTPFLEAIPKIIDGD